MITPTHYYEDNGRWIVKGLYDGRYFYMLCDDGTTWSPEPVYILASYVKKLSCDWPKEVK